MPVHIDADTNEIFELADLVQWLRAEKIDTSSHDDMTRAAPALKALGNNREFLADLAVDELKRGFDNPAEIYRYSAQVMLLHLPQSRSENFFIRANFWPSEKDQPVKAAGLGPFFYNRPHDHNFNFLTVGYFGPGYWSNYYEYDHADVSGYPGEHVPSLTFIEKRTLPQGHVMLYRASVDVHEQLPADSMSISLNILENTPGVRLVDQYSFDLERSCIKQIINIALAPCVFSITAKLGGPNGQDVLHELIRRSPDPFTRFSAYKALAGAQNQPDAYCQQMQAALSDKSPMVTTWARQHIHAVSASTDL